MLLNIEGLGRQHEQQQEDRERAAEPLVVAAAEVVVAVDHVGGSVGEELLRNPRVRRIAFTGSTPVGRKVTHNEGDPENRLSRYWVVSDGNISITVAPM